MLLCVKISWNVGAFKPHFATTTNIGACDTIGMMLCMKIFWNSNVSKPHSKFVSKLYLHACDQHHHDYE
jgi:hypothetical protein